MTYYYFVSYSTPRTNGFGCCQVLMDREISAFDDLTHITKILEDEMSKEVTILYYNLLRKGK